MSLINSMLRDLEARRSDGVAAAPFQGQVRAVPASPAPARKYKLAAALVGALLLALAAAAGQRWWQAPPQAAVSAPATQVQAAQAPVAPAPAAAAPAVDEAATSPQADAAQPAPPRPAQADKPPAAIRAAAPAPRRDEAQAPPAAAPARRQPLQASTPPVDEATPLGAAAPAPQALKIVPEAVPQPDLALQQARQQLQDNAPREAIATLQRALPQAGSRADFHAFLAALLQRDEQHRAAADHFAIALRGMPDNGVWWMGLGISWQALQMAQQAQQAYRSALAGRGLSPELAAFVEARLAQLERP